MLLVRSSADAPAHESPRSTPRARITGVDFAGLPHQQRRRARQLVADADLGHAQRPAEEVGGAAQVVEAAHAGSSERHPDGAVAPRAAETVVDDHADVGRGSIAQLVAQARRARVGVLGKEQHAVELLLVGDVRLIDARVRQHEAEPVRDHQHSGAVADHLARLAQDHLDQPRILVDLARER